MRKMVTVLLCIALMFSMVVTGVAEETRIIVDSTGREVEVPAQITKIAVSGPVAQIFFFALAPDEMVGLATKWDSSAEDFISEEYLNMPLLGQLYGGKSELNLETLLSLNPDVIIDVGEAKKSIAEDMDALQEQTGIPCIHIESHIGTLGESYRMAGELLGKNEEAEALAVFCDEIYGKVSQIAENVEKVDLLYVVGQEGLNVIAKGSYHAEIIDMLANNLAVVDEPSSKGTGNEVDMEQILNWNPSYVIFAPDSIYDTVAEDANWQGITAIQNGAYAEAPIGPCNWMGFPPAAQRILGMMWMAKLLYPEAADYDLYEETARYFELFYHCNLSVEQYESLLSNSINQ